MTHKESFVFLLGIGDDELPSGRAHVADADPRIVRDDVRVDGQDGLGVGSDPADFVAAKMSHVAGQDGLAAQRDGLIGHGPLEFRQVAALRSCWSERKKMTGLGHVTHFQTVASDDDSSARMDDSIRNPHKSAPNNNNNSLCLIGPTERKRMARNKSATVG